MTTTKSKGRRRINGRDELQGLISASKPVRELVEQTNRYPVELLQRLCAVHRRRGGPVPDHELGLSTYLGDMAVRALIDVQLIQRVAEPGRQAINSYMPTKRGLELYDHLEAELVQAREDSSEA